MKKIKKMIFNPEDYVSLPEARKLRNKIKSDAVFLWDRYNTNLVDCSHMTKEEIVKAMDEWVAKLPSEKALNPKHFRLVRIDTFDSGEQIEHLIKTKKFFYAPLKQIQ